MDVYNKAGDNPLSVSQTARTISLTAIILAWVAGINGHPLLFDDTLSYWRDGMNLVRLKWPDNQRPVFYGLAI